jgi:4-hydroxybenzoate polyprenyltransferase
MAEAKFPSARTLLVLGRVSNLPTVWSNCLCGWLLAGGGSWGRLLLLCFATSLLYIGGMYLNDAFDASFDRQHRRQRPIPSGAISEPFVWIAGLSLLGVGTLPLLFLGLDTALLTVLLVAAILLYDAVHKAVEFSPIIMAVCRFFLLLVAASAAEDGVTGLALWTAIALAGWIVGLSYVARRESILGPLAIWPLIALALPIVLAFLVNNGPFRLRGLLVSALVLTWAALCLRHTFTSIQRNLGRTVSGLLAGICLVDLLAAPADFPSTLAFVGCFGAALLLQRFIPAT